MTQDPRLLAQDSRLFWFIFNPKSGTRFERKVAKIKAVIKAESQKTGAKVVIKTTTHPGHAAELARQAAKEGVTVVVAVGGDGTMNEVARELLNSPTAVGIVPMGSGNGLARHLGISMNVEAATHQVFYSPTRLIDSALLNEIAFFCTAGMGFDAYVAGQFAQQTRRGFATYLQTSITSFQKYQPQVYRFAGQSQRLFTLSFANASQFGNNAYIAPRASTEDGLLDVCQLKPFSVLNGLDLARRLFDRSLDESSYAHIEKTTTFNVQTDTPPLIHYDGESLQLTTNEIRVQIVPTSLRIVAPF